MAIKKTFDIKNILIAGAGGFATKVALNKMQAIPFIALRPDLGTAILEGVGIALTFFSSDKNDALGHAIIGAASSEFVGKFPMLQGMNGVSRMYPQNGVSRMQPMQNGALEDEFAFADVSMNEALSQLKNVANETNEEEAYTSYQL